MPDPFVLLDDARESGAANARLYRTPRETVTAMRVEDVPHALARLESFTREGLHVAGYMAYEAGMALEPRLTNVLATRQGATGPLLWFGVFDGFETIPTAEMPQWLAAQGLAAQTNGLSAAIGPLEPQIDFAAYQQAFNTLHDAIEAGDIYQANLTFPLAGPWRGDPLMLYASLRPNAAAGWGGVIHDGSHWLLSFSPEMFFTLEGQNIRVKPMKGTRPRGRTVEEDAALRTDLKSSIKDRAENLMILDLMRNDVARVAQAGSVRVNDPFAVETYPTVHQMVSTVTAQIAPDVGVSEVLRALFPCGSITGAPKIRAMELIAQVEKSPRGPYCGSIGYIEPTGDAAFNVAIRTLRLTSDRNGTGLDGAVSGRAVLGVGSAIVADSQALSEWRECLIKGSFVRKSEVSEAEMQAPAIHANLVPSASPASFDLVETMRFTPETGVELLELHLKRISESAMSLGFGFDRHAVRNAIQALCFEADKPSKLRLVVGRTGAYALELGALPPALPAQVTVAAIRLPVDSGDWRLRHKTSDRSFYDRALSLARSAGAHEGLFLRDDSLVTEGCFTNLFVARDGILLTPPAHLGLLSGVLRQSLIEAGRAQEAELALDDLANGFFIGNALRGLMPATLLA